MGAEDSSRPGSVDCRGSAEESAAGSVDDSISADNGDDSFCKEKMARHISPGVQDAYSSENVSPTCLTMYHIPVSNAN